MRAMPFIFGAVALAMWLNHPAVAQTPSPQISNTEMSACRSDAVRLCFFKISQADALRACLRENKPNLSTSCRGLIEKRGN